MKRLILFLVCAGALHALGQQTGPKVVVSPDKKFEYRVVEDRSAIYAAGTNDVALDLSVGVEGPATRTIIWAPDSRRLAFNYTAGGRVTECALYELVGTKWKPLPEIANEEGAISARLNRLKDARAKQLKLSKDADRRRIYDLWHARRWLNDDSVEIFAASEEAVEKKGETESITAAVLCTVKCDNKGAWSITKMRALSEAEATSISDEIDAR